MGGMWLKRVCGLGYRLMFRVSAWSSGGFCRPQILNHILAPKCLVTSQDSAGRHWEITSWVAPHPFSHTHKQGLLEISPPTSFLSNEWLVLRYVLRRPVWVFPAPYTVWPDQTCPTDTDSPLVSLVSPSLNFFEMSADDTKRWTDMFLKSDKLLYARLNNSTFE